MKNLSSLSKAKLLLWLSVAAIAASGITHIFGAPDMIILSGMAISALLLVAGHYYLTVASSNLHKIKDLCRKLAEGQLEERSLIPLEGAGEIEDVRKAINHFTDMTDAFVREAKYSMDNVCRNHFYRMINIVGMHGTFLQTAKIMNDVTRAADKKNKTILELANVIRGIVGDQHLDSSMGNAAAAGGIESIAAATEESSAAIGEINRQINQTSQSSVDAEARSNEMADSVQSLVSSTKEIAAIVDMINGIAEQTNLLALNATIEAARAGDSGKGFAVVAGEVKKLASETSDATLKISDLMQTIQTAVDATSAHVLSLKNVISMINESTVVISSAVEEQSYASQEIARSATMVSTGLRDIGNRVSSIETVTKRQPPGSTAVQSS